VLAQNAKFCEQVKVFQGAGLLVKALLDAAAREPEKKEVYMEEVWEESEVLVLWVLVLPCPVPSSVAVATRSDQDCKRLDRRSSLFIFKM